MKGRDLSMARTHLLVFSCTANPSPFSTCVGSESVWLQAEEDILTPALVVENTKKARQHFLRRSGIPLSTKNSCVLTFVYTFDRLYPQEELDVLIANANAPL